LVQKISHRSTISSIPYITFTSQTNQIPSKP
jgi:hypothetical protein